MKKTILFSISAAFLALSLTAAIVPSVFGTTGRFRFFYVSDAGSTIPSGLNTQGAIVGTYRSGRSCFGDLSGLTHGFLTNNDGATISSIDVPGATSTKAGGINDGGIIVGTYQTGCQGLNDPPGTSVDHGYRLQGETFTLFNLPATTSVPTGDPFGGPVSVPVSSPKFRAINNNNDIVGEFSQSCTSANPFRPPDPNCVPKDFGFILRANGNFQALEACDQLAFRFGPGCAPGTTDARGINDNSVVVGHFQDLAKGGPNGDNVHHGFIYQAGPFTPLLCNGDSTLNTEANGINNQGIIVGACADSAFVLFPPYRVQDYRVFSFTPNVCPTSGFTLASTVARDISNTNKIVGSVRCEDSTGRPAFIFGFTVDLSNIDASAAPARGTVVGVTIIPNPVTGGNIATGTITLSAPAGPTGVLVTLSSNNGSAVTPPTVIIPAGQTSATFTVTTTPVNGQITATITAISDNTVTTPLVINPPAGHGTITGVSILPDPVTGGKTATGIVTITAPAGPGGVLVTLSSDNGSAVTPVTVTIPAGQTSTTFTVTTTPVNSQTTATITATSSNSATTPLIINPAGGGGGQGTIASVGLIPNPVTGGNTSTGTVTLTTPAGPGGVLVTLASNNGAATTPTSVTIPAGQSSATFPVTTLPVNSQTTVMITATSGNTTSAPLTINPAGGAGQGTITGVSVVPNPVTGGNTATGTVTLAAPAGPGGVLVTLGSNNGSATTPASVTVPAGQTSATFPVTTTPVNNQSTATISATSSNTATTPLVINPANGGGQGTITGVSVVPNPVTGGNTATGTVTLAAPAGPSGVLVTLGSNNGSATTPASVTVPAGQTSTTFTVTTTPVNSQTTATISATSGNTATTPLLINPAGGAGQGTITGVSVVPNPVTGGNAATGTVTLAAPAGPGGVLVTLSSNNGSATTPASATIPAGQTSAAFPVTTTPVNSQTTATISATSSNTATTPLVINPAPAPCVGTLTLNVNAVTGGSPVLATVTLTSPAPAGGTPVQLVFAGAGVAGPSSILVPAGQNTATFVVNTSTVASLLNAVVTAITGPCPGVTANLQVTPPIPVLAGVSVTPSTIDLGGAALGTVNLSAVSATDTVVNLFTTLPAGQLGIPATVTIPAGATSMTFPVISVASGLTGLLQPVAANISAVAGGVTVNTGVVLKVI